MPCHLIPKNNCALCGGCSKLSSLNASPAPLTHPFPPKMLPTPGFLCLLPDLPVKSFQFLLYAHPEFSSLCLASQPPPVGSAPWAPQTSSLLLRQWDLQEHNLKTTTTNDQRASLDCGTLHFQLPGSLATWRQTHNINKIITADLQTFPQTSCHLTLCWRQPFVSQKTGTMWLHGSFRVSRQIRTALQSSNSFLLPYTHGHCACICVCSH